jgi:hypothetical protein
VTLDAVADRTAGIDARLGAVALLLHAGNHLLRSAAFGVSRTRSHDPADAAVPSARG